MLTSSFRGPNRTPVRRTTVRCHAWTRTPTRGHPAARGSMAMAVAACIRRCTRHPGAPASTGEMLVPSTPATRTRQHPPPRSCLSRQLSAWPPGNSHFSTEIVGKPLSLRGPPSPRRDLHQQAGPPMVPVQWWYLRGPACTTRSRRRRSGPGRAVGPGSASVAAGRVRPGSGAAGTVPGPPRNTAPQRRSKRLRRPLSSDNTRKGCHGP
jgi:hypothetical protein